MTPAPPLVRRLVQEIRDSSVRSWPKSGPLAGHASNDTRRRCSAFAIGLRSIQALQEWLDDEQTVSGGVVQCAGFARYS